MLIYHVLYNYKSKVKYVCGGGGGGITIYNLTCMHV